MNNSNPLIPHGSLLEQKNKGRARVRLAVFFVLSLHVVVLIPLLVQGCKREEATPPIADTNAPPAADLTNVSPPELTAPPAPPNAVPTPGLQANLTAAGGPTEYVVARGDSFYTIGKQFGVSMKAIADANPGVDSAKLQIGKKLVIPAPPAPTAGTTPSMAVNGGTGENIYVVASGDTLIKIAIDHGVSVKALRAANNLTTDKIKVGQKLKIPAKAPTPPSAEPAPGSPAPSTTPPPIR